MSSSEVESEEPIPLSRGSFKPGASVVSYSGPGESLEELSEERLDSGKIKQIGLICSGFVVCWVIISGAWDIYQQASYQMELYGSPDMNVEELPVFEYRNQTLFERIFCSGAKRSSFCSS